VFLFYSLPAEVLYFLGTATLVLGIIGTALFGASARYFHINRHVSDLIKWMSWLSCSIGALFLNIALFGISGKIGWEYSLDDFAYAVRPIILIFIIYFFIKVVHEVFKADKED